MAPSSFELWKNRLNNWLADKLSVFRFVGFEENIRVLEDREGVLFPVKKLFIIITKSLYCPPDLKEFTKEHEPHLESFNVSASYLLINLI